MVEDFSRKEAAIEGFLSIEFLFSNGSGAKKAFVLLGVVVVSGDRPPAPTYWVDDAGIV